MIVPNECKSRVAGRLQVLDQEIRRRPKVCHTSLAPCGGGGQHRKVGKQIGVGSLESDPGIIETRNLLVALDMHITSPQMQEGCRRYRVVDAETKCVRFDMLADGSRNRLRQAGAVIGTIGLGPGPISGQLQPGAQQMIDLDGRNLRNPRIHLTRHIVIEQARPVRQRNKFLNLQRHRIQFLGRNDVVGVRIPVTDSIDNSFRGGVVNHVFEDRASQPVGGHLAAGERFAEIAPSIRQCRHRNREVADLGLAELFKIDEEECLIVTVIDLRQHRTTETETPIVSPFAVPHRMPVPIVGKRPARVKRFVDEIVVNAPMELVGPRPHGHVEQTTARLAVFSREVAGLDRDLLDGFHALLCLRD